MQNNKTDLLQDIAIYYSEKLAKHGQTPCGVDWNGEESQTLRFNNLCKVIETPGFFSLNDLGCGYGALYEYLVNEFSTFSYLGVDVSKDMIHSATQRHPHTRFITAARPDTVADYGIASGIFNVRVGRTDSEWREYIETTLDGLDQTSRLGFAFNCLTSYSDADKMRDYLYYSDPCTMFDFCKRRYSNQVALLHDYGLYEFTIIVRKVV